MISFGLLRTALGWVGPKVKKWFGLTNLTGPATILAGLILLFGAGVNWFREDAINDANAKWELRLAKEQAKLKDAALVRDNRIRSLEEKLQEEQQKADAATFANNQLLEKQRETVPLSEACNSCRVPNERLWVRPGSGRAADRVQSKPGS